MAISNLQQLRETAPENLKQLSDRELVSAYAQQKGESYEKLLSYFGVGRRGTLAEMGSQALVGLTSDLPEMAARSVEYFAPEGSGLETAARSFAEERAAAGQYSQPDVRGKGLVSESLISGARALAPVGATMAAGLITGGVAAPAVASGLLFGGSSAQETENKVLAAGGTKQEATRAGIISGLIQGAGETVATVAGAKLVMPFLRAGRGAATTARVAEEMATAQTGGQVLRNAFIYNPAIQGSTEVAQDIGTALTEQAYGVEGQDFGAIAGESLKGGIGLALILGPFGAVSSSVRSAKLREFDRVLNSEEASAEERAQAQEAVRLAAEQQGISEEDRDTWLAEQIASETQLTIAHRELEDATNKLAEDPQNEEAQARVRAAFTIPTGVEITDPTTGEKRKGTVGEVLTYARPEGVEDESDLMAPVVMDADMFVRTVGSLGVAPAPQAPIDTTDYFGVDRAALQDDLSAVNNVDLPPEERSAALSRVASTVAQYKQEAKATETVEPLPEPVVSERLTQGKQYRTSAYTVRDDSGKDVTINITRDSNNRPTRARVVKGAAKESPKFGFDESDKNRTDAQIINKLFPGRFSWGAQAAPVAEQAPAGAAVAQPVGTTTTAQPTAPTAQPTAPTAQPTATTTAPADTIDMTTQRVEGTGESVQEEITQQPAATTTAPAATTTAPAATTTAPAAQPAAKVVPEVRPEEVADPTASEVIEPKTDVQAAADIMSIEKEIDKILEAKVTSDEKGKVQGRKSLPANVFATIRNSILSPTSGYFVRQPGSVKKDEAATAQYGDKIKAVSKAARDFLWTYKDFLDQSLVRSSDVTKKVGDTKLARAEQFTKITKKDIKAGITTVEQKAAARAAQRVGDARASAEEVQVAYDNLLKALDGNKKDLDILVRIIKDKVQAAKLDAKANPDHVKKWQKLDINLSRAVDEIAQTGQEQPSLTFVRRGDVRPSREQRAETDAIEEERTRIEEAEATGKAVKRAKKSLAKREATLGKTFQLVAAAESGYAPFGGGDKEKGIRGVMNYFRQNGTQYEKTLANALGKVFENMGDKAPTTEFIAKGTASYDPGDNTITLTRTSSPEVVLHESLHGALQWFVYNNPEHPAVKALIASVNEVTSFKKSSLGAKAQEVQAELKKLKKEGSTLDAVLELISYGNTLQDFKEALDNMPVKTTPKSFVEAAQDIWKQILAVVKEIIGGKQTQATEVMQRTFELLTEAAQAEVALAPQGKVLKADVVSEANTFDEAIEAQLRTDSATTTSVHSTPSMFKYAKRKILLDYLPGKFITDAIGFKTNAAGTNAVQDAIAKQTSKWAQHIRDNYPLIERQISLLNSTFSVSNALAEVISSAKSGKHIGINKGTALAELMRQMEKIKGRENFTEEFVDYMDGNKKALDKYAERDFLKGIADDAIEQYNNYIESLEDKQREYMRSGKFSERLFMPKFGVAVGKTIRAIGVQDYLSTETVPAQPTLEKELLFKDANGDVVLEGRKFYQVLDGDGKHSAFVDTEVYGPGVALSTGETVDTNAVWEFDKYTKAGYKFKSTRSAKQALLAKKKNDVHLAVQNTFALLAQNKANKALHKSLASDKSVVFDNIEQVKEAVGDKKIKVITAFSDEFNVEEISNTFRSSNSFVKLPNSEKAKEAYGELAGKIMHGPVFMALQDSVDRNPIANSRKFYKIMSTFKWSKTSGNPATHVSNALTNFSLMYMHDIPFSAVKEAGSIYLRYKMGGVSTRAKLTADEIRLMTDFQNSGAMIGDYSTNELRDALFTSFMEANDDSKSIPGWLSSFMDYEAKKNVTVGNLASKLKQKAEGLKFGLDAAYAAEDNVFRLALFMKQMSEIKEGRGAGYKFTAEDVRNAGSAARKGFLDYDIDSKAVRIARQTVFPFISWTYAIIPVISKIAITKPWKLPNLFAAYGLTSMALGALAGDDDEETRERGPKYLRERLFGVGPQAYVRIPFMGDSENPVYYNLGHYMPLHTTFRGDAPAPFMGIEGWPGGFTPSNPLFSLFSIISTGIDPYTGEAIDSDTNSSMERAFTRLIKTSDVFLPTLIDSNARKKLVGALEDKEQKYTGAAPNNLNLLRLFGLRTYQHNQYEWEATEAAIIRGIESDFRQAISDLRKEELRKGSPDYEALDREIEKLEERMRERIKEETNEDM